MWYIPLVEYTTPYKNVYHMYIPHVYSNTLQKCVRIYMWYIPHVYTTCITFFKDGTTCIFVHIFVGCKNIHVVPSLENVQYCNTLHTAVCIPLLLRIFHDAMLLDKSRVHNCVGCENIHVIPCCRKRDTAL